MKEVDSILSIPPFKGELPLEVADIVKLATQLITLQDAYFLCLRAPQAVDCHLSYNDYSKTILSNLQRVLKVLSLGGGGAYDLTGSISLLRQSDEIINLRVEAGIRIETDKKRSGAPDAQNPGRSVTSTLQRLARQASRISLLGIDSQASYVSGNARLKARVTKRNREPFRVGSRPQSLTDELAAYKKWALSSTVRPSERIFREKNLSAVTVDGRIESLNQYLKWRIEHKMPCRGINNLMEVDDFYCFTIDFLKGVEEKGYAGHESVNICAVSLGILAKYLTATLQIDPEGAPEVASIPGGKFSHFQNEQRRVSCKILTTCFYNIGKDVLATGLSTKTLRKNPKITKFTPEDMLDVGAEGF
ncbi:hypothetical protein [Deinococcus sp. UYEF24]